MHQTQQVGLILCAAVLTGVASAEQSAMARQPPDCFRLQHAQP